MFKLGHIVEGEWVEYSHPAVFEHQTTDSGTARLRLGIPGGDVEIVRSLARCMEQPYYILYVLLTPRGEGNAGRYQSPLVDGVQLDAFLSQYADYFRSDGRFALWIHSPSLQATLAWDHHNLLYAYGPLPRFEEALRAIGFTPGQASMSVPHAHNYHSECDTDAAAILVHFDWRRSELQPGDDD
ncbi:MAG TPA: hypothetical protein VJV39_15330 [Dongiaceae bacterium]|nr:hypothetical protein [Dongiaceae bacterium]